MQEETHKDDNGRELSSAAATTTGHKSQQDTKGEGQSATLEEVCYPLQEPCEFCDLQKQGNMDYVWK